MRPVGQPDLVLLDLSMPLLNELRGQTDVSILGTGVGKQLSVERLAALIQSLKCRRAVGSSVMDSRSRSGLAARRRFSVGKGPRMAMAARTPALRAICRSSAESPT